MQNNTVPKPYVRDKRSPVPKNEHVSKSMRGNKSTDTKPEILLRKMLGAKGIRGYRLHYKKVAGRPDIAFVGKKTAVFVHGCFWHRCPTCNLNMPKHNTHYWQHKFDGNTSRDAAKKLQLENEGWRVVTIWECELKKEKLETSIQKIADVLEKIEIEKSTLTLSK